MFTKKIDLISKYENIQSEVILTIFNVLTMLIV